MDVPSTGYLDDGLIGIASGDALGVTSEFVPQHRIPHVYRRFSPDGWPFAPVGGGWLDLPPGGHSDDTEMALCIYKSIQALGRFDPVDISARFVAWMKSGPRDIGSTILGSLSRIARGRSWLDAGRIGFFECRESASNGSLMRNGLIGYIPSEPHDAFSLSLKQCLITHYSPLPVLCCCAQTYIIRLLLEGLDLPVHWQEDFRRDWQAWIATERDSVVHDWIRTVGDSLDSAWSEFMDADFSPETFDPFAVTYSGRSGHCLLTLQIAVWVLHRSSMKGGFRIPESFPATVFERHGPWALGWAAMLGYDSDTYCSTAGPMLSARYGGLPDELVSGLMVHDWM